MRRVAIVTISTAAGVIMLLSLKPHTGTALALAGPHQVTVQPGASQDGSPATAGGSGGSSPGGGASGSGTVRSGTFTGDPIDTRYGPVQVAATLANGKLTAVKVLQVPDNDPREDFIVSEDVPQLTQEALAAGNAQIDAVSGATFTSMGYVQSLQSALDKARA